MVTVICIRRIRVRLFLGKIIFYQRRAVNKAKGVKSGNSHITHSMHIK